jgi:hypothetical protein
MPGEPMPRNYHLADAENMMVVEAVGATPVGYQITDAQGRDCVAIILQGYLLYRGMAAVTSAPAVFSIVPAAQLIAEMFAAADRAGWGPALRAEVDQRTQDAREFYRSQPSRPEGPIPPC